VTSGRLVLSANKPLHVRLTELHRGLVEVLNEFSPSEAVIEKVFFARNVKSALTLGHARGVVLMSVAERDLDVFEYSPLEVKKAVTGYGRAIKSQVQDMVRSVLGLEHRLSSDSADALALALCHKNLAWYQGLRTA
jgi:crossover junction endodeoxyribonuclease RuvC